MKKVLATLVTLVFVLGMAVASAAGYPAHQGRMVNDYVEMLDPATKERIEKKLREFDKRTSSQFAVAIVADMGGEDVEGYAVHLFEKWRIGQQGKDNGVLLLVAKAERKVRIEVGYGLEGELTDLIAGRIIDQIITPAFKKGDFAGGIEKGLDAMMEIVAPAPPKVLTAEERMRRAQEAKREHEALLEKQRLEKEKADRLKSTLLTAAGALLLIGFISGIGYLVTRKVKSILAERRRIRELKDALTASLESGSESLGKLLKRKQEADLEVSDFPVWMKPKVGQRLYEADLYLRMLESLLDQARQALADKSLLVKFEALVSEIGKYSGKAEELFEEVENFPAKIAELKKLVEDTVAVFGQKVSETEQLRDQMLGLGYKISVGEDLAEAKVAVENLLIDYYAKDSDPSLAIRAIIKEMDNVAGIGDFLKRLRAAKFQADTKKLSREEKLELLKS